MNTTEFLLLPKEITPDRTAIIYNDIRLSFNELNIKSNKLANFFLKSKVAPGDRIAILQVNCNEIIESYFATSKVDAIYVPLNFRSKKQEILHLINDSSPKILLVGKRYIGLINSLKKELKSVTHFISLESEEDGWLNYNSILRNSESQTINPKHDESDTNLLIYTAGTTGKSKGVMLSHNSFSSFILNQVDPVDPEINESNILTVPLFHIAGIQSMLSAIYAGRTLIIQSQFDAKEWLVLAEKENANRAMMVPTMLKMILDHPDFKKHNLQNLKIITYGAAPMPKTIIQDAIKKLPWMKFINAFGQTETAATITMLPPEDHILESDSAEELKIKQKRLTSIGKPLNDIEVKIVDAFGENVQIGKVGEIVAKGERLMKGYWNRDKESSQVLKNGWLYTGDLGYFDKDGYIFLSGRSKDIIKRGGEMIAPSEVEEIIRSIPGVEDVAVIGIPDTVWGEKIIAIVVPKNTSSVNDEEIIEYCHDHLSSFKKPEKVIFENNLPTNPLGKVLKNLLRDKYSKFKS